MLSTPLILNEWVIHDLRGENGQERQSETYHFLERVERKCDHLVVLRGSLWTTKAFQLMKESDERVRYYSKFLHVSFLRNPSKCKLYDANELVAIPRDVEAVVPSSDVYLIGLYLTELESVIVTTDKKLAEALSKLTDIRVRLRDEFLTSYV
jgi:hypothetical protein